MQRGRKQKITGANVVALRAVPKAHLKPPTTLTTAERVIFVETAAQYSHLKPGDAVILAAYAQASVRAFTLAKRKDTQAWNIAVRTTLALARSLRLTPINSTRADALGRKRADQATSSTSYYDKMRGNADDD